MSEKRHEAPKRGASKKLTCTNVDYHYMMFECSVCGARSIECMMYFKYCPGCGRKVTGKADWPEEVVPE